MEQPELREPLVSVIAEHTSGDDVRVADLIAVALTHGPYSAAFRGQMRLVDAEYASPQLIRALMAVLLPFAEAGIGGKDELIRATRKIAGEMMDEEAGWTKELWTVTENDPEPI